MAKKNNKTNRTFTLRGDSNIETALNTANAIIGGTMTLVWGTSTAVTTGTEIALDIAPKKIAKAIHKAATSEGLMSTWDSVMAEDASEQLAKLAYETKDKWLGSRKSSNTKALDKALKALSKDKRKEAIKMLDMAKKIVKGLTDEKINKLIKKHGTDGAVEKIQKMIAKA